MLKLQYFGHQMQRVNSMEKSVKGWRQEEKQVTEEETIGWQDQLNGHEFEQILGDSEGQESLMCCSPWGHEASDTT